MESQSFVRVLIADKQPVRREGLVSVLIRQPDIQPVGAAESEGQALALCQQLRPDVVVVDGSLLSSSLVQRIRKKTVLCRVVVLVGPAEAQAVRAVVKSGVDGIVSLTESPEKIIEAIRKVAQGSKYLPETLLEGDFRRED